jgi:hypothetical protein
MLPYPESLISCLVSLLVCPCRLLPCLYILVSCLGALTTPCYHADMYLDPVSMSRKFPSIMSSEHLSVS